MAYISHQALAERPGARELAQVATAAHLAMVDPVLMELTLLGASRTGWGVDQIAAADDALARIDDTVTAADGVINGFLVRRGYTVPITPVPALVSTWSRDITRYLLHKDRLSSEGTDPIVRAYKDALALLQQLAAGKFSLGAGDPIVGVAASVQFESTPPVFGRAELDHFR